MNLFQIGLLFSLGNDHLWMDSLKPSLTHKQQPVEHELPQIVGVGGVKRLHDIRIPSIGKAYLIQQYVIKLASDFGRCVSLDTLVALSCNIHNVLYENR
jgi:hypothetical protein